MFKKPESSYILYKTSMGEEDYEFMEIIEELMDSLNSMSREELSFISKDKLKNLRK